MQSDHYHFVTNWRVRGKIAQVAQILRDPVDLPRWWPSVYIQVTKISDKTASVAGYDLLTRGWLPYKLKWHMQVTETQSPHGYSLVTRGDMVGVGVITLAQDGAFVDIVFDWEVVVRKPIVRLLSSLIRPLISTNHRWAMSRGQMSIERELLFRVAKTAREREVLPAPPGPMPAAGAWATFVLVMLSIVLPGSFLMHILKRKSERADGNR